MNKISSQDRSALIRLASGLPVGDENRKAILAGLSKRAKVPGLYLGRTQLLDAQGRPEDIGGFSRTEGIDRYVVVAVVHGDYNDQEFTLRWTYKIRGDSDIEDGWYYDVSLPNPEKMIFELSEGPLSEDDLFEILNNAGWDELSEELYDLFDSHYNTGRRDEGPVRIER